MLVHSRRRIAATVVTALFGFQLVTAPAGAVDPPFSAGDVTVTEPGGLLGGTAMRFEVRRPAADAGTPDSVDYTTADVTATAGRDYVAASGSVFFEAGEVSREVRVDVVGDLLDEATETFALKLSKGATSYPGATGTIEDDSDAPPSVSVSDAFVDEGGTAGFLVTLSAPSGRQISVDFATANGTATAGADYTATNGPSLSFAPGEISKEIVVPVAGDVLDEDSETFAVNLAVPAGSPVTLGNGTGTGTIFDDDGMPSVSVADAAATEGAPGAKASFKVSLSAASGRDVEVTATALNGPLGGTGANAGSDFEATNRSVTIPAGQTEVLVDIPVLNDSVHESTETFTLLLSGPSNAMSGDMSATGTITDDDAGPVLTISDVTDTEAMYGLADLPKIGSRVFSFTVTLAGNTATPTNVSYAATDGSAKQGTDYTVGGTGTLTFLAGQGTRTQPVTVTITNDTLAEDDETFTVNLSNPTGGASLGDPTGLGKILNDDGPPTVIALDDATPLVEGGTAVFTLRRLTAPPNQAATVSFATRDGSARAGRDYVAKTGVVTFAPGDSAPKTVTVALTDDTLDEEDTETFGLDLSDPINAVFENNDAAANGAILDNDATPTFIIDPVSVPEGNSNSSTRNVDVRLSAESGREVKVNFATVAGTAFTPADFAGSPPSGTLTFSPGEGLPGETVEVVRVNVVGDELDEDDENLRIKLSNGINGIVPALLAAPGAEFRIIDDDATPTVSIAAASIDEPGDGGSSTANLSFPIQLSAISGRAVTVKASTGTPATAEGGDYDSRSNVLVTIPAGVGVGSFVVVVHTDADGDDETFTVTLSSPTNATIVAPGTATGTIVDDDGPPILRIEPVTVGEGIAGGKATVTVRLFPTSTSPVTANWETVAGSAVAPADFTASNGQLAFAAGESIKTLQVPIAADTRDEADESFTVRLTSGPGSPLEALVTITDDDGPVISAGALSVTEGNSGTKVAEFTVTLSAPSPQTVTVGYGTVSGSAQSPADFTAVSGSLSFGPNETSKKVPVSIVGDTLDEADEDFSLAFSNPTNATAGTPVKAVIVDDDQPNVSVTGAGAGGLGAADPSVVEGERGNTPMTFAVRLDAPTARDVVVSYAVAMGGTAFPGADHTATAGRLTFSPGETVKNVVVAVKGDALDEADETVVLRLLSPVNGTIIDTEAVGTIIDDDEPGYAFVATDGGMFTFGAADFAGSTGDKVLNKPIVGMAAHPSGRGYWLVASDGGVFAFGEAPFKGSTGNKILNKPIVGMAAHPSGEGYWLVAEDGGIFSFGAADFHGSTGGITLNKPIVGMAAHPSGNGYWLVATDGGIFSFDAPFKGSTGDKVLNKPIVGMAAHPSGNGYWFVASDGGVFSFNAPFKGSTGDKVLNKPVVGMAAHPSGDGYWLVADDGGVFSFNAPFLGSTGDVVLNKPVKGMAVLLSPASALPPEGAPPGRPPPRPPDRRSEPPRFRLVGNAGRRRGGTGVRTPPVSPGFERRSAAGRDRRSDPPGSAWLGTPVGGGAGPAFGPPRFRLVSNAGRGGPRTGVPPRRSAGEVYLRWWGTSW